MKSYDIRFVVRHTRARTHAYTHIVENKFLRWRDGENGQSITEEIARRLLADAKRYRRDLLSHGRAVADIIDSRHFRRH